MITNDGIELISKYLAGQAGSYASYIAVGCGQRPLSNEKPIIIAASGTLGTVSGSGPFTATLTIPSGINYVQPGDVISEGGTRLGSGVVTVVTQGSPTTLSLSSTASMTAGSLTNIAVIGSLRSKDLSAKTKLDFEMARFPITSRSYVVDKQSVKCDLLATNGLYEVGVSTVTEHPFVKGDTINISNINKATYPEVNGLYVITSVTSLGFAATPAPGSFLGGWTSVNNYAGFDYNNFEFTATVYSKQISLTAELSETLPYDITELGVYSLGSDQYSTTQDSRILLDFTQNESWEWFNGTNGQSLELSYTSPIAQPFGGSIPFFASCNDSFWTADSSRTLRQEKPRFQKDAIVVPGDLSDWSSTGFFLTTSNYLVISNPGIDLSNALSTDKVVLAFSVANAKSTVTAVPNQHHIMLQFMSDDGNNYAQVRFDESSPVRGNRYQVLERNVGSIFKTSGFDWKKVSSLRIYASIQSTGEVPTNDYAYVLDGLRLESSANNNPLYALTAYTIVNNDNATKITKSANSRDLINFRLDLAIGQ